MTVALQTLLDPVLISSNFADKMKKKQTLCVMWVDSKWQQEQLIW